MCVGGANGSSMRHRKACPPLCVVIGLPAGCPPISPLCSYDPRTLHVPAEWLRDKKVSPGQLQVGRCVSQGCVARHALRGVCCAACVARHAC